jgi:tetratricopeptide (TPR) repeat protein
MDDMNDQKQDMRVRFDDRLSEDERQVLHAGQLLDTGRVEPTRERIRWVVAGLYDRPGSVATSQALSDALGRLEEMGFLSSTSPIALEPAYTRLDVDPHRIVVPYAPNRSIDEDLTELTSLLSERCDGEGLVGLGIGFSEREKIEQALDCFNQAVEADPSSAKAWNNRGVILGELSRTQEALESYNRAIEVDPSCARAWYNRRIELVKLGRFDEAVESLEKTRELDPDLCD